MVLGDEPVLNIKALTVSFSTEVVKDVVVLHLRQHEDVLLRLPGVAVLHGKDLHRHHIVTAIGRLCGKLNRWLAISQQSNKAPMAAIGGSAFSGARICGRSNQ